MLIVNALSRLLRPPDCLACGAPDSWPCCAACLPPEPAGPGPWRLAADPTVTLWALGLYGDGLRAAIVVGKFRGQAAALHSLGRRLGAAVGAAGIGADLVTWIAARPARGLPRDHAEQIATGVAAGLDVPLVGLLAPAAGRDLGRARRDTRGRAAVRPPPRGRRSLAGGRVLVVDDVATTGRTLAGAAGVLRQAGAGAVEAAVLAAASTAFGPAGRSAPPSGRPLARRAQPPGRATGRGNARDPPATVPTRRVPGCAALPAPSALPGRLCPRPGVPAARGYRPVEAPGCADPRPPTSAKSEPVRDTCMGRRRPHGGVMLAFPWSETVSLGLRGVVLSG
jgi:predicted amidophosphoribosyltransferase